MVTSVETSFSFVAASVLRAVRIQRAACEAVLNDDSNAESRGLAQHLDQTYDAFEQYVAQRRGQFKSAPDDAVRADAVVDMRQVLWNIRKLQSNLAWLDASQHAPIDLGTKYFVEQAARTLVAQDVEVTVVATDQSSYATTSNPYEGFIQTFGTQRSVEQPVVVVIFIPRREQYSGLLHPLIVHELGHAADSAQGLVDQIWASASKRKRLNKRFAAAVGEFAESRKIDPSEAIDHIVERFRGWIAEAFCDAFATQLLGPTYLYSFLVEVVAASIDDPGSVHPPPRQRVRQMMDQLRELGWADHMAEADPSLSSWVEGLTAQRPAYSGIEAFLSWGIDELQAVIAKAAATHTRRLAFRPDPAEIKEVSELLDIRVPPAQRSETGAPVAPASIMLCCWTAALRGAGGGPAALADAPDAGELAELLPAALELSALVEAWS